MHWTKAIGNVKLSFGQAIKINQAKNFYLPYLFYGNNDVSFSYLEG